MKLTKLLAGAGVAALLTTAAHSQAVINVANLDGDATNDLGGAVVIASERNIAGSNALAGTFEFNMNGTGAGSFESAFNALAITDSVDITISLSGGLTLGGNLSNANVVGAATQTDCEPTIQSGGVSGTQTVTYRVVAGSNGADATPNDVRECDQGNLAFSIPVAVRGAGNLTVTASLASTGTQLATATFDAVGGGAVQELVRQSSGYNPEFTANTGTVAIDLQATPSYVAFDGASAIGSVEIVDAGDGGSPQAGVLFAIANAGNTPTDATADAQIDSATLTVTLPQPAGIASVTLAGVGATQALTNGVATFNLTATQVDQLATARAITLNAATGANAAPIANQTPQLNLTVSSPTASNLTIAAEAENGARLLREGSNSTNFEWVGDTTGSATNVWRFTGISPTNVPTIRATLSGSSAGSSFDREYTLSPSNAVTSGGELVVLTQDLRNAVGGDWGRATVSFSVEASGVSVRRFILGANGTLTTFDGDFDVACGTNSATVNDAGTNGDEGDDTIAIAAVTCTQ